MPSTLREMNVRIIRIICGIECNSKCSKHSWTKRLLRQHVMFAEIRCYLAHLAWCQEMSSVDLGARIDMSPFSNLFLMFVDQIWSVILPPSWPPSSLAVGRNCAVQGSGFATWLFASRHGPWTRLARASRMDHGDSGCYCHISLLVLLLWLGCFASPLRTGWSISGSVSSRRAPVLRSWESHDLPVQRGQYRDDPLRRISWSCGLGMIGRSSWDLLRFGACVEVMFAGCLGCALEFRCFIGCSTRTLMIFNYPMCNLLKTLEKRACSGQD